MIHSFYKEDGTWYIDLPEYIESGIGNKADLMLIAGADTFLDRLSGYDNVHRAPNRTVVKLRIESNSFEGYDARLVFVELNKDQETLDAYGHPPVDYGATYIADELFGKHGKHQLWLCPVTEYIFNGIYPTFIFIKILK
jgi:hypothetical protein